ncbi:hypothetical protein D083_2553 [Dickeya solani RNS 08.23.3.1.A]|nr:hypothetical protein D083_2553 [Dickeya solani RNS 08.23.3.1.A]
MDSSGCKLNRQVIMHEVQYYQFMVNMLRMAAQIPRPTASA